MHPLLNGSQATERPAAKPIVGTAGWFTESGDSNKPSFPGQDWFNKNIAEFQNALLEMGVTFDPTREDHLKLAFAAVKSLINSIDETQHLAPSSNLFSDAIGIDSVSLPVSLERNRTNANQDRWIMLFGDSHSWGQGAPDWDQFTGMSNFSRHSSYPHSKGWMSKIAEHVRNKLNIKENLFSLGGPLSRNPITNLDYRTGKIIDITGGYPLEVILGNVSATVSNLSDISADTITQFYAPVARQDVDSYSLLEYREKLATSLFNNSLITLKLENINRFTTQGKDYKVMLPPNPAYAGSGSTFTQLLDSRGNIVAEYHNTNGQFFIATDPDVVSYPEWFKVGAKVYFHGSRDLHKIAAILPNGAVQIQTSGGVNPGATLAPFITDNLVIYHGEYILNVLLKATTPVPSRVTYVHVRHHANGGNLKVAWVDAISGGSKLTPYLNSGVSFRKSSNSFQPVFSGGNPTVHLVSTNHNLIAASAVSFDGTGVVIDTSQRTVGVDEELIYRIDWGSKQVGDLYLTSQLDHNDDNVNIQTRGVIFDNNKIANFAMGAHTVGAWIGSEQSNAGEIRNHLADILNYTPVRPSHILTQIPFVNEYIKQTPIAQFKANLTAFVNTLKAHLSSSNNYNFNQPDFMFFTSIRDKTIAFEGAAESAITYDMYSNAAREFCDDFGHAFIDCEKELFRLVSSGRIDYQRLYSDNIHPSDFANSVIQRVIMQDYLDFIC
ncbi:MAG: hypothetical protein ACRDD9_16585 [Shewanella sp.]